MKTERAADAAAVRAALDDACFGLDRRSPEMSARRVMTAPQLLALGLLAIVLWFALDRAPDPTVGVLRMMGLIFFGAAVVLRLFAVVVAIVGKAEAGPGWRTPLPRYTILCPLHREAASVTTLIEALQGLDYPADLRDVKLVLEADDGATLAALLATSLPVGFEIVIVPTAHPRTKPKALNYALKFARGDFVAIYDAEDRPHPQQLRAALDAFARGGETLGAVQAPLLIDNVNAGWIASQFAAEYVVQFRGILPLLARIGAPLPLGGASNHFRRAALEDAGGWDSWNVTEDADLAYRLARRGWRLGVIAPPTWEEAPARFRVWRRQRTRWIKGHVQTWLVLMRRPDRTISQLGWRGFLWMQLVLGGGIVAAFAHAPLLLWLLTAIVTRDDGLALADWVLAIGGYATAAAAALLAATLERNARLALSALTMPFYWPLASLCALAAMVEILFRPHYWAKTDHGLSLRETPSR
ncbi:MAG: glycosyltransferase family 2 protein [Hyphomonadaceae bacterium]|nr:glycosyltransferase family 2 protein [Hyphomonadaceae bacterium]